MCDRLAAIYEFFAYANTLYASVLFTSSPIHQFCDYLRLDLEGWFYYKIFDGNPSFYREETIVVEVKIVGI